MVIAPADFTCPCCGYTKEKFVERGVDLVKCDKCPETMLRNPVQKMGFRPDHID